MSLYECAIALHSGRSAIAFGAGAGPLLEFQKLVDHPAILFTQPIGALARLQIARGYRVTSNRTKAVTAYETFLKTWATADPGVPIFNAAQSKYQMIHSTTR